MQRIAISHGCGLYYEHYTLNISYGFSNHELDFEADDYHGQIPDNVPRYEYVKSWLDTRIADGHKVLTAELFRRLLTEIMDSEYRFRSVTCEWVD